MWRCVGESSTDCLTVNHKGMEMAARYQRIGAFPSSSHPLILSFLRPKSFLSGEVMLSVHRPRETAKLGRTGWSGRRGVVDCEGVEGCLESKLKTLKGRKRTATAFLCTTRVYESAQACECCYEYLAYQLRLVTGQPKRFRNSSLPWTWSTQHLLQRG